MTTENGFLEENHSSWAQPATAEAVAGAASPGTAAARSALRFPRLPTSFPTFPSVLQVWPAAGERRTTVPRQLPPRLQPRSALPLTFPTEPAPASGPPGRRGPAARTRTRRHWDSPRPGHARKLCLTLQNAQPLGTKNSSCASPRVFLSAGYTPSSRSIFSIGGTARCRLHQGVVFHGPPGPPRCRAAAGEYAVTGLLSDPAFLSRPAAATGKLLRTLPNADGLAGLKVAPGSPSWLLVFWGPPPAPPSPFLVLLFFKRARRE